MSRFVRVLKSTPATHIVNKNRPKLCLTSNDIFKQCAEALALSDDYPASAGVFVSFYDIEALVLGVLSNSGFLIGNRVLLILRGHSQVLRSGNWNRGGHYRMFPFLAYWRVCHTGASPNRPSISQGNESEYSSSNCMSRPHTCRNSTECKQVIEWLPAI